MRTLLGLVLFFITTTLLGWAITLIRVRLGHVKHGQQAIEEYWGNVEFAVFMTFFLVILGLESWIG